MDSVLATDMNHSRVISARLRNTIRVLAIAVPLYFYTWLGFRRNLPPISLFVQLLVTAILCAWWVWRVVRQRGLAAFAAWHAVGGIPCRGCSGYLFLDRSASQHGRVAERIGLGRVFFVFCDLLLAGWSADLLVSGLLIFTTLLLLQGLLVTAQWYGGWYAARVPEYPAFLIRFRLFGVADWPTQLAALINLVLPFAILRLVGARGTVQRVGWAAWLLMAEVVLFLTSSRAGWAATVVVLGIVVGWLLLRRGLPWRIGILHWVGDTRRVWATTVAYGLVFLALFVFNTRLSPSEYTTNAGGIAAGRDTFGRVALAGFPDASLNRQRATDLCQDLR